MGPKIVEMSRTAPLQYLLMIVKALLVLCKISRLFIHTLCADGKYSLFKRDNLTQPIQMQVSGKQKTFSEFFAAFLKFR